jgi:hypothetical protein
MMKYLILILALVSQTASARTIVEERKLTPNVKLTKYSDGWVFKDYWTELSHPTCEINVPAGAASALMAGLFEYGYFPVETTNPQSFADAIRVTELDYKSYANRYGCAQTDLVMRMSFLKGDWIPFYYLNNLVACIADTTESLTDILSLFHTEQMPKCVKSQ